MIRVFALMALSFSFSGFSLEVENKGSDLEKVMDHAQDQLPRDAFHVVENKFQFLNEISLKPDCEDTFHVVDVAVLADRFSLWKKCLADVEPYYALKTNNDPMIASVLAMLGTGFDCASEKEIEQVLGLGVNPSKIVFANPRKPISSIHYAKRKGVDLMTFDSVEELDKLSSLYPQANLLLRIKADDSLSSSHLSEKFGATLAEAYEILDVGFERGDQIVGVAFHVGSNCTHLESYRKAILDAAELFRYSKKRW